MLAGAVALAVAPRVGRAQVAAQGVPPDSQVVTGLATTIAAQRAPQSIAVIGGTHLDAAPTPTLEEALQGQVAGVNVQQNNGGAPGGGVQVQIRGVASINSDAEPLYVIDGVILNNQTVDSGLNALTAAGPVPFAQDPEDNTPNRIADINPADIARIEVLKGPAASAIYGSKGAAGAILITTKRGTSASPVWDLTARAGTYLPANTLPLRSFPTYASANAWWHNDAELSGDLPTALYSGVHNYQSQLFGGGEMSGEGDLSVRGAPGRTNYFVSLLDKYDNGVLEGTGYQKEGARVNLSESLSPAVTASTTLYYQHSLSVRGVTGNDNDGFSPYDVFATTPSFFNLNHREADGTWALNPFSTVNPFADVALVETPSSVDRFIGGGSMAWQAYRDARQSLRLLVTGGANVTEQHDLNYAPPFLEIEELSKLPGTVNVGRAHTQYDNASVNVVHEFTGLRDFDATSSLGISEDDRFVTDPDEVGVGLDSGTTSPVQARERVDFEYQYGIRTQSLYAQEQIVTLAQRLSVMGGATAERNAIGSTYSPVFVYPKVGAAYQVPKFAGVLDALTLRAAFGEAGTAPAYGFTFNNAQNFYASEIAAQRGVVVGVNPNTNVYGEFADSQLQPERSAEIETGIDATFLAARAQLSATIYEKHVTDLVLLRPSSALSTLSDAALNGGAFTNQGIELSAQLWPVRTTRGVSWLVGTTFSRNYSRVDALAGGPFAITPEFGQFYGTYWAQVGRSVSQIVNTGTLARGGDAVQVGNAQPSFIMTLSNTISWRRLRVYGLLDWHRGGSVVNLTNAYYDNGLYLLADSAASTQRLIALAKGQTPYVEPASFLKVREITLSYDVPDRWLSIARGRLRSARVSASAHDVFAVFRYSGLDPEVSDFGNTVVTRGQDVTPYPPARSLFLSLDLGF